MIGRTIFALTFTKSDGQKKRRIRNYQGLYQYYYYW